MNSAREAHEDEADREAYEAEVDPEARSTRTRRRSFRRGGVATGSGETEGGAGTSGALVAGALAGVVRLAAALVAGIIVAGILLIVLEANPTNDIVSAVHDAAKALVGPFDGMFSLDDTKATVAVNWGIAAVVYLIVGLLIARLIESLGAAGLRRRRARY